jgi:hypothetical protein
MVNPGSAGILPAYRVYKFAGKMPALPVGTITDGFLLLDKRVQPLSMDETINHHIP